MATLGCVIFKAHNFWDFLLNLRCSLGWQYLCFRCPISRKPKLWFWLPFAAHIMDESPRLIFEILGGREVAVEIPYFSNFTGITGVHLDGILILKELLCSNGFRYGRKAKLESRVQTMKCRVRIARGSSKSAISATRNEAGRRMK